MPLTLAPTAASEPKPGPGSPTNSQPGRVIVQSAAVALSYYPHSDPCLQGGQFETSDLARFAPSGELILQGRVDSVINIKGKKIQPAEIETTLRAMPGVEDVVVMPLQDSRAGAVIRAVVVKSQNPVGDSLNEQLVRRFCRERLAEYKVPRSIVVVRELPLTARGKLDRSLLRQADFDPGLSQQAHFEG